MKKLLVVLVLGIAGVLAYNAATGGGIPLLSGAALSPEEQQIADLEEQFEGARQRFGQAERSAGLTGMDSSSDAEAAIRDVDRVAKAVAEAKRNLTTDAERERAARLERSIEEFRRQAR